MECFCGLPLYALSPLHHARAHCSTAAFHSALDVCLDRGTYWSVRVPISRKLRVPASGFTWGSHHSLLPPAGLFAPKSDCIAIWAMLTSSWINLLLLAIPLGIVSGLYEMDPTLVFISVSAHSVELQRRARGGHVCHAAHAALLLQSPQRACVSCVVRPLGVLGVQ